MTAQERKDLATRKRILEATGSKNYELRNSAGKVIYSKRTRTLADAKKDLEARKKAGTADEKRSAERDLAMIEKAEKLFSGAERTTR